jgi:hypothetical protein
MGKNAGSPPPDAVAHWCHARPTDVHGPYHLRRVQAKGRYVTVEFERLSDDPTTGPTSVGHAVPGAEIVAALEGFSHEHSLAIPLLRALLMVIAMREMAGLAPRRELRIDVVPADPLPQDSLSTHRSESVHPARTRFGG